MGEFITAPGIPEEEINKRRTTMNIEDMKAIVQEIEKLQADIDQLEYKIAVKKADLAGEIVTVRNLDHLEFERYTVRVITSERRVDIDALKDGLTEEQQQLFKAFKPTIALIEDHIAKGNIPQETMNFGVKYVDLSPWKVSISVHKNGRK